MRKLLLVIAAGIYISLFCALSQAEQAAPKEEDFIQQEVSPREVNVPLLDKKIIISSYMFKVDFQGGFSNEKVLLYVDGKQVFSKIINSNLILSLAGSIKLNKTAEAVSLTIVLPEKRKRWVCSVGFSKGSYIGIQQNKEEIIINQSMNPFLYD
jgi:hypothetical protein